MNASNTFNLSALRFTGSNGNLTTQGGSLLVQGIGTNATLSSGITYHRTQVISSPYTVLATDYIIGCLFSTSTSGVIIIPSGLTNTVIIKDESGTAHIANITISGSPNIERSSSFLLNGSGAAVTVYPTPNGWRVL